MSKGESELLKAAAILFKEEFGVSPEAAAAAPGRVNLIGEHTDYNDGFVLPMALPLETIIVGRKNNLSRIRVRTNAGDVDKPHFMEVPIPQILTLKPTLPKWGNYVTGVVHNFKDAEIPGFDAIIVSSVPVGGGLSSSAALEVCTHTFLETLTGVVTKDLKEKALRCQRAEHEFAGVPCGIMDQFISTMAQEDTALLIDCRSMDATVVPMADPDLTFLITNSNVKHELAAGEYAIRRQECEEVARILGKPSLREVTIPELEKNKEEGKLDEVFYKRAHHVIGEIARTKDGAAALARNDKKMFGELMYQSHDSLSKQYEVSCSELDELVKIAKTVPGVHGSRMTGGGFGGCTITLVEKDALNKLGETIKSKYSGKPSFYQVKPSSGARVLRLEQYHLQ